MAYSYYASITVDNTKVGGTANHVNYPVLISGTYDGTGSEPDLRTDANGGNVQNTDSSGGASGSDTVPADLAFYNDSSATTQYDHEIISYNASTGEIKAWVEVPTLDYNDDTVFYIHYGDSGVTTSQENISGTWNSNFGLISHTQYDPSGTAPQEYDSTTNSYDGTSAGGMTSGDLVTGKIHKALDFDRDLTSSATVDRVDYSTAYGNILAGQTVGTISLWVNIDSLSAGQILFATETTWQFYGWIGTSGQVRFRDNAGNFFDSSNNEIVTGTWYLLHFVRRSNSDLEIYKNGSSIATDSSSTGGFLNNTGDDFRLGCLSNDFITNEATDGPLEELRVMSSAINTGWALTDYNNQNSPSTFYTMGNETSATTPTGIAASKRTVNVV